ncbi:hypothetical protein AVEN_192911-1 [Araneus ventricosus]|uniref:Uncharacterized protein n=1 Tax=Araneus ventricosus TaxID=182803 RepID=A0A4Y2JNJ0_ARAVE|nr:hypothetical protein AVEN_192911-1 [Araneus ventricosus]
MSWRKKVAGSILWVYRTEKLTLALAINFAGGCPCFIIKPNTNVSQFPLKVAQEGYLFPYIGTKSDFYLMCSLGTPIQGHFDQLRMLHTPPLS